MTRSITATVIALAITAATLTRLARNRVPRHTLTTLDYGRPDPCDVRLARLSAEATMLRAAVR